MIFNCLIAGVGGQGTVLASKLIAEAAMRRGFEVRTTETIGMAQRGGSVVSHIRIAPGVPDGAEGATGATRHTSAPDQPSACATGQTAVCIAANAGAPGMPGEYAIFSPLIPTGAAHALIAFEPSEAARCLPYLAADGALIVCDSAVKPFTPGGAGAAPEQPYDAAAVVGYIKAQYPEAAVIDGRPLKEYSAKTLNTALLGAAAQAGIFPFAAGDLLDVISEIRRFREQNIKSFEMGRDLYNEYIRRH